MAQGEIIFNLCENDRTPFNRKSVRKDDSGMLFEIDSVMRSIFPDIEVLIDADDGSESGGEVEDFNDAQDKVSLFAFFRLKLRFSSLIFHDQETFKSARYRGRTRF